MILIENNWQYRELLDKIKLEKGSFSFTFPWENLF